MKKMSGNSKVSKADRGGGAVRGRMGRCLRGRASRWGVVAVVGLAVLAMIGVTGVRNEAAGASVDSCLATSGAADVVSVQNACRLCRQDTRGALWINGSSTNRNSSTIDITAEQANGAVDMYIWGQVYSCARASTRSNVAYYIWVGHAGQMIGNGQNLQGAVNYVSDNNASKSLYRGTGIGRAYTWYQPLGSTNLQMKLDVKAFIADAATKHTTEQDAVLGTVEVYRATVSVNRCNNAGYGKYVNTNGAKGGTCYGDDSEIVVRIAGGAPVKPDDATGEFYSTSSVKVEGTEFWPVMEGDSQKDGMRGSANEGAGDAGWVEFTADYDTESVPVKFWHNLTYTSEREFAEADVIAEVSTAWSTDLEGADGREESGEFVIDPKKKEVTSGNLNEQTVMVRLEPGETKTVCQTISYDPKWISFTETGHVDGTAGHETAHDHYEYSVNGSGNASSQACVKITRPLPPDGVPYSQGRTRAQNMFVGETAELGWDNLSMASSIRRRVTGLQSVVYLVPANKSLSETALAAGKMMDSSGGRSLCEWFNGKSELSPVKCEVVDSIRMSWDKSNTYKKQETVAVPNLVGYKYCNSAGYFVEYWHKVCGKHGCYWVHDYQYDHWRIYDSACRTIAKKPTISVWNSGVFVDGAVNANLALRYTNDNDTLAGDLFGAMGESEEKLAEDLKAKLGEGGDARAVFGSWAEHLLVANGEVKGFASGAALSRGGTSGTETKNYSSLTIANANGEIGQAGVTVNQAMRTRLESYLKTNTGVMKGGSVTEIYQRNGGIRDTRVIVVDGNLRIEENITMAADSYENIYQIPKAVIFVQGDVEISGEVEQIDAWIIATGKIDACEEFSSGTETAAVGYRSETAKCDKRLMFNGAVMAGGIELHRMYGVDPEQGTERYTAAEVFNLSAENYLWAYAQAGRYGSSYSEAYTRELAPRY